MQQTVYGCGSPGVNNCGNMSTWGNNSSACVTCVGKKPVAGTPDVAAFAPGDWNDPAAVGVSMKYGYNLGNAVPAFREVANQVQCYSTDGNSCATFPDGNTCNNWALSTIGTFDNSGTATPPSDLSAYVDKYVRQRV